MSNGRRLNLWKRLALGSILGTGALMICLFQNFKLIPIVKLKPDFKPAQTRLPSRTDGTTDIRDLAPPRYITPEEQLIATPQSGNDLNGVSQDWMMRQTNIITGGAEQRMLDNLNQRLNRWVRWENVIDDDWVGNSDEENDEKPEGDGNGEGRKPSSVEPQGESEFGFKPASLRFTAVNRLQLDLKNRTKLSCSFQGDMVRWDVSRPISDRFDVNLQHETTNSKSVLQLNYNW